ncbi:MAG: glycosyltransferase family 2 protein [Spirochaetaceae bacterium]|nr:glycosyltransferase family 2 protein [Spirochaetaceae bacterium]
MTNPLVSVIIPAYNHEKYICETIFSIINQTYKNIELLIVDDGSGDSTYDKICDLEVLCRKRFKSFYFNSQKNKGISETLNTLINMSAGEYIFLIASDDIAAPHAIETELSFLENNPDYALCVGNNDNIDGNSRRFFWDENFNVVYEADKAYCLSFSDQLIQRFPNIDFFSDEFGSYYNLIQYGNHIPNGYLIRKSIFEKTNLYVKEAPLEDYWIMLQISKYAKMKYLSDTLFYYRNHGKNTISTIPGYYTYKTLLYEFITTYSGAEKNKKCNQDLEQWKQEFEQCGKNAEVSMKEYEAKIKILKKMFLAY